MSQAEDGQSSSSSGTNKEQEVKTSSNDDTGSKKHALNTIDSSSTLGEDGKTTDDGVTRPAKKRHIDQENDESNSDLLEDLANDEEQLRFLAQHLGSVGDDEKEEVEEYEGKRQEEEEDKEQNKATESENATKDQETEKLQNREDDNSTRIEKKPQEEAADDGSMADQREAGNTQEDEDETAAATTHTTPTPIAGGDGEDDEVHDPIVTFKLHTMPVLDNLATQILSILAKGGSSENTLLKAVIEPDSKEGIAFREMLEIFEQVKKVYSKESFLSSPELDDCLISTKKQKAIIQRANLSTFVCAIFGLTQIGFFHLNKYFIDAFVGDNNGRLLKIQGGLYLELKTQAYISAMKQDHEDSQILNETLYDLFPEDIDKSLLARRPRSRSLVPSEIDFANRCKTRREYLQQQTNSVSSTGAAADELSEKYDWLNFVKDLHDYLAKNITQLINENSCRYDLEDTGVNNSSSSIKSQNPSLGSDNFNNRSSYHHVWQSQVPNNNSTNRKRSHTKTSPPESGSGVYDPSLPFSDEQQHRNHATTNAIKESSIAIAYQTARAPHVSPSVSAAGTTSSGAGSSVNATSGTTSTTSRTGTQYFRRPWTREEEAALMHGLDQVQGPHWSQILELHGAGGTISEVLKDRTQVQLKDKARNLKLFFIKGGHEIPSVLKYVTGDSRRGKKQQQQNNNSNTSSPAPSTPPTTTNAPPPPAPQQPSNPPAASQSQPSAIDPELESQIQKNQEITKQPRPEDHVTPADANGKEKEVETAAAAPTTNIEELLQSVGDFINSRSKDANSTEDK